MPENMEHAYGNAKAWFENLRELYRECQEMERDDLTDSLDQNMQRLDEMPLSVEVRSPWYTPGSEAQKPAEFAILLTTGGPALRVWGELDEYGNPTSARLEMQDWFTPWREVWPCELNEMDEARAALMWFAQNFYFGE